MTVREGFIHSVNLVFIRLMRDIVGHHMADNGDARRRELLARFADREGSVFLERFYRKYQGRSAAQAQLLRGLRASPSLSLVDRAYVARVHPLELWLVGFLQRQPDASLGEVIDASRAERQEAYTWLFRTRHRSAQDQRIRTLLESDAFTQIHRSWRRLGYPFESLTPSYASAIGAAGDRPAALAELIGIIANDGARLPMRRIDALQFARDTPYETRLERRGAAAEPLLAREVAETLRRTLVDVVEQGTARRLKGALLGPDGRAITVGGKTGTGDHRFKSVGRDGRVIAERVLSRSATFVFTLGGRYFGTLMVYVQEPAAVGYHFTSALPVQLLKSLGPPLLASLQGGGCRGDAAQPRPVARSHEPRWHRRLSLAQEGGLVRLRLIARAGVVRVPPRVARPRAHSGPPITPRPQLTALRRRARCRAPRDP